MFRVVLLVVALAIGGGAAWLATVAMRSDPVTVAAPAEPVAQVALQEVLVAASDVGRGQALSPENMRWQSWPESALNAGYISRAVRPDALDVLSGSLVRSAMISGEPIREEKLLPLNAGFLAAMLPPGKRAMAVRVSAETTAGGLILPNDRVDVVHTTNPQGGKGQISRTILKNIPVLAIDQTLEAEGSSEKAPNETAKPAPVGKTATLELDSRQAEILANAEATGTLSLALRSAADSGEPTTVDFPQVIPAPSPPAPSIAAPSPPAPVPVEPVLILRGGQSGRATRS
jgi:pilus assembly protein CpaB